MVGGSATDYKQSAQMSSRSHASTGDLSRDLIERRPRRPSGRLRSWMLVLLCLPFTGCATIQTWQDYLEYSHPVNELTTGVHSRLSARDAWRVHEAEYADVPHLDDFADGFRVGYADVARGEIGCPPPLPPRKYWRRRYESPAGREQVAAWYAGYDNGADLASTDGVGAWRPIPPSPRLGPHPLETLPTPRALVEFSSNEMLSEEADGENLERPPGAVEPPLTPPARRSAPAEQLPIPSPEERTGAEELELP
jgi:hypothetical protein